MDLRNHKDWDKKNGLLSVSLEPYVNSGESNVFVLLNGSTGNFCLDYDETDFNIELAKQRAWSSNTGYYVKILGNNEVKIVRWWDGYSETLPASKVVEKPEQFYKAITKNNPTTGTVVAFAKEVFIRLRNCIQQSDNGHESLRTFMYLLAALEQNVESAKQVNRSLWGLEQFDTDCIAPNDWEMLYSAFQKGGLGADVKLVLRHASNRLFQEAHREATRKAFQTAMFGGAKRSYNSSVSEGAFYTPTPLVRTIVQETLWALNKVKPLSERASLRILDPACGSAEFLREALRQLKMNQFNGNVIVAGWDKSPIACEMARFVLQYESRTEWNNTVEIKISKRDSVEYDWASEPKFDLVFMNPPFIAFKDLGKDRKCMLKEKLENFAKGESDIAGLFWKNASEIISPKGALGLVLPQSLLGAETYARLRDYIKGELGIDFSLIGRLGSSGLFEQAMVIPSILVGVKKARLPAHTVLWTSYQQTSVYEALRELRKYRLVDIPTPIVTDTYSIYEGHESNNMPNTQNWVARSYKTFQLAEHLKDFDKVGKFFEVSQGIQTGNDAAFLLKKESWKSLPKNEQAYFRPAIIRGSIKDGQLNDDFYLFYPYGEFLIETETELIKRVPNFYNQNLRDNNQSLRRRKGREVRWWDLSRHRPQQIQPQPKIISARFGKSGYFGLDLEGKYLVASSYSWGTKKEALKEERYQFAYLAILHAPLIDVLLEMVGETMDGGYYELSKRTMEKMPLPDLSEVRSDIVSYLTLMGKRIHNGEPIDKDDLNEAVASAYGLELGKFMLS